jgi:hypothetical protein
MPDFTKALAAGLDAKRNVFLGKTATLSLLDYATNGRKGYDVIRQVLTGWFLHADKEIEGVMVLQIAELDPITREMLDKSNAFGIYIPTISAPAKIWIDEGRKAPTYPSKRIWTFNVKPSGEFK